jgi:hypothetical protein
MIRFWVPFVLINIAYFTIFNPGTKYRLANWSRIEPTLYITDRTCVQLSYIWNYGAPRGCEVTEDARRMQGWEYARVPLDYWLAPSSVLLHDVIFTRNLESWAKIVYLIFLLGSGAVVTCKYIIPEFKLRLE